MSKDAQERILQDFAALDQDRQQDLADEAWELLAEQRAESA